MTPPNGPEGKMKERVMHFLVLDRDEDGAALTVAIVKVRKGRMATARRAFVRATEDRGMWCTQIHPCAAKILHAHLSQNIVPTEAGKVSAGEAAECCRANK